MEERKIASEMSTEEILGILKTLSPDAKFKSCRRYGKENYISVFYETMTEGRMKACRVDLFPNKICLVEEEGGQAEMKITDKQAVEAIRTIKEYCEERRECEECAIDCSEFKKGQSPCYWLIPNIEEDK